jgi:Skp family chaperone for outer membrane proteins
MSGCWSLAAMAQDVAPPSSQPPAVGEPQGTGTGAAVNKAAIPAPVIVVVDPQAALQQSKAGQAIRAAHDKYLQGFEGELQAGRKSLSETEAELAKQKATMPFDEWQKKAQAFDQRVVEFNQKFQKINLAVEKSYRTAMTELGHDFTQVTAEIANEMGATLVLPIQQVILHDPRMDLTKAVIERMDKRYPSITFPPPDFDADQAMKKDGAKPGKK